MLRLQKLALAASLGAMAMLATAANAQTVVVDDDAPMTKTTETTTTETQTAPAPSPVIVQPAPAPTPVYVQPAPAPTPVIVTQPAPAPMVTEKTTVIEEQPVNVYITERPRDRMMTLSVGGGVSNFTDDTLQDRTGLNGAYEARLMVGTRSPLAFEAAYVGTAGEIDTLGLDDNAVLISNGVEGLARLNIGTLDIQPYVVGGASWVRYNVVNADFNTSDVRDEDDVLAIPFGGGLSTYIGDDGFMLDARFTYRVMFEDELIRPTSGNSDGSHLDNWMATLKLGYAF